MPFKSKSKTRRYQKAWNARNREYRRRYNAEYYASCPEYWKFRRVAMEGKP